MIKIELNKKRGSQSIHIQGHACYGNPGADIVCAAVTTLFYTLEEAISRKTKVTQIEIEEGSAYIEYLPTKETDLITETIVSGWKRLAENYPKNVSLKK